MTADRDFETAAAALQASLIFRAADRISFAAAAAWDRSSTAQTVRGARGQFERLGYAGRVRAIAVTLATASVGHRLLLFVVPPQVAPATPRLLWSAAAVAATVVAIVPRPFVASWRNSLSGTVMSMLRRKADATREPFAGPPRPRALP
jgi:hypothetical protein